MKLPYAVATLAVLILCWAVASSLTDRAPDPGEQARADSLRVLRDSIVPDLEASVTASDSVAEYAWRQVERVTEEAAESRRRAEEAGREAEGRAVAAGAALGATLDSLANAVPEPLRPLVEVARTQAEERDRARQDQLTNLSREIGALELQVATVTRLAQHQRGQVETRDLLIGTLNQQLAVQERQTEYWRSVAQPGRWERLTRDSWKFVAGAGIALAAIIIK